MLTITLLISLSITSVALFLLKPIAHHSQLLDIPGGRKQHNGAVPLIGGLAIFMGIALTSLLMLPLDNTVTNWLLCSLGIILLGVGDDAEDLSVRLRIIMQTLLTLGLCLGTNTHLGSLGNLLGLGEIHLGVFSYPFTVFLVLGTINAFNMIDGIDGLLGSVSLITLLSMALLFNEQGLQLLLTISLMFVAALLPYLLNNLAVRPFHDKVFMGDAGSMLIGLTIVWLLMAGSQGDEAAMRPVTALWLIALPLVDMLRVIVHRLRTRRSPFHAGRDHLHHVLLSNGLSKYMTLFITVSLAATMAGVGLLGEYKQTAESIMFISFLLLVIAYQLIIGLFAQTNTQTAKQLSNFNQTEQKRLAESGSN